VRRMSAAPIVLVPGFWLGAWAWDQVVAVLRAEGHDVTALTLPGLASVDDDRSAITFADHVDAVEAAVLAAGRPVVLAVHSGAGGVGHAVSDRVPEAVATMVYVDTGAATGPLDPSLEGDELPPPTLERLREEENLDGLTEEQLAEFLRRAVPEPAGAVREGPVLSNDARLAVPTTVVCTAFDSAQYRDAVAQGYPFLAGLADLHDVTYLDLPTSHWPMWSRPRDLADLLSAVARGAAG
jgi:pimeloyl-ACP methyl ester carboxylesterase